MKEDLNNQALDIYRYASAKNISLFDDYTYYIKIKNISDSSLDINLNEIVPKSLSLIKDSLIINETPVTLKDLSSTIPLGIVEPNNEVILSYMVNFSVLNKEQVLESKTIVKYNTTDISSKDSYPLEISSNICTVLVNSFEEEHVIALPFTISNGSINSKKILSTDYFIKNINYSFYNMDGCPALKITGFRDVKVNYIPSYGNMPVSMNFSKVFCRYVPIFPLTPPQNILKVSFKDDKFEVKSNNKEGLTLSKDVIVKIIYKGGVQRCTFSN